MIICSTNNLKDHAELNPGLEKAQDFLLRSDLDSLPEGKHEIQGDDIFAIIETCEGKGKDNTILEAHRRYIDVQFSITGQDIIGIRPLSSCERIAEDYKSEKDIIFFHDQPLTWIALGGKQCIVFFPQDCHAPLSCTRPCKKAVIKIKI